MKHLKNYILLSIVTIANFWLWQIFSVNPILFIILLLIELGLFALTTNGLNRNYTTAVSISVLLLLVLGTILLKSNFDTNLSTISPTELSILNERNSFLTKRFGDILPNKYIHYYKLQEYSLTGAKYLQNVFYALDPNLYFFKSHPREKVGIIEYEKYSPFVLPFFVFGILIMVIHYRKNKYLIDYSTLAILVTGFINPGYKLGPLLMFPAMNIILYLGLVPFIQKLKFD